MHPNFIISLISRIHKRCEQAIYAQLKSRGYEDLAPTHGEVLYAVLIQGAMPMQQLSQIIHRDKSTVTALVNKLQALGYVERRKGQLDSRQWWVAPTPKADVFKEDFVAISQQLLKNLYGDMPDKERLQLVNSLAQICQRLDRSSS